MEKSVMRRITFIFKRQILFKYKVSTNQHPLFWNNQLFLFKLLQNKMLNPVGENDEHMAVYNT